MSQRESPNHPGFLSAQYTGLLMYSSIVCGQNRDTETRFQQFSQKRSPHNPALKYLLQRVGLLHRHGHGYFGGFLNFSSHQELVQDEVSLLKVKNDVQLTHLEPHTIQYKRTWAALHDSSSPIKNYTIAARTLALWMKNSFLLSLCCLLYHSVFI